MNRLASLLRTAARCFVTGALAVLPLVITVAIVAWVAEFAGRLLGPGTVLGKLLQQLGFRFADNTALAYLVGWIVVLTIIFGLGVLAEAGAKRWIHGKLDALLHRVPLFGGLYGTARQLVSMLDTQGGGDLQGMSVVYCTFGRESGAVFLALLPTPHVFRIGEVDCHAVIVPTSPVPVGGGLIFVPVQAVRPAKISVDALMSIYVSMGVTGHQFLPQRPQ